MASNYFNFYGKAKWAKVYQPDEKYNRYSINLYLEPKEIAKYKSSGMQGEIKEDDEGSFIKLGCPVAKLIKNELVKFDPPKVTIKTDTGYESFDKEIGNGSEVGCNVIVYDSQKGKGHRLLGVTVYDWVEYKPKTPQ